MCTLQRRLTVWVNCDHSFSTHSTSRKGGDAPDTLLRVVRFIVVLYATVVKTSCLEEVDDWLLEGLHGLDSACLAAGVASEKRGRRCDTYFAVLLFRPEERHRVCGLHLVWCLLKRFGREGGRKMLQSQIQCSRQGFTQTEARLSGRAVGQDWASCLAADWSKVSLVNSCSILGDIHQPDAPWEWCWYLGTREDHDRLSPHQVQTMQTAKPCLGKNQAGLLLLHNPSESVPFGWQLCQ